MTIIHLCIAALVAVPAAAFAMLALAARRAPILIERDQVDAEIRDLLARADAARARTAEERRRAA